MQYAKDKWTAFKEWKHRVHIDAIRMRCCFYLLKSSVLRNEDRRILRAIDKNLSTSYILRTENATKSVGPLRSLGILLPEASGYLFGIVFGIRLYNRMSNFTAGAVAFFTGIHTLWVFAISYRLIHVAVSTYQIHRQSITCIRTFIGIYIYYL